MSLKQMQQHEREKLFARMKQRGLGENDFTSTEDLVVGREGLVLGGKRDQFQPRRFKPASLADLLAAVGPSPEARKYAHRSELRTQRDLLLRMAHEIGPRRGGHKPRNQDKAVFANLATRALVNGALTVTEAQELQLDPDMVMKIAKIDIRQWLWPNITVQAGTTLSFSGSGVHTLQAYRLTVEPGARIVINNATVSIDCVHLVLQ